jgi:hypothetical protein
MLVPQMLDNKGTRILAKSLFKELRGNGYSANQILGLTTELIDLVTQDLRDASVAASSQRADSGEEVMVSAGPSRATAASLHSGFRPRQLRRDDAHNRASSLVVFPPIHVD